MNNFIDNFIVNLVIEKNNHLNKLIKLKLEKESIIEGLQNELSDFKDFKTISKEIIEFIRDIGIMPHNIPDYEVEDYIECEFPNLSSEFKILIINHPHIQVERSRYLIRKKIELKLIEEINSKNKIIDEINFINNFNDTIYKNYLVHSYLDIIQNGVFFGDTPDDFEIKEVEISCGEIITQQPKKYPRILKKEETNSEFYSRVKTKVNWLCEQIICSINNKTFVNFTEYVFKG